MFLEDLLLSCCQVTGYFDSVLVGHEFSPLSVFQNTQFVRPVAKSSNQNAAMSLVVCFTSNAVRSFHIACRPSLEAKKGIQEFDNFFCATSVVLTRGFDYIKEAYVISARKRFQRVHVTVQCLSPVVKIL
jgi:hypothetical protein